MSKPSEVLVFEFLESAVVAADPESPLFDLELHDTIHQKIRTPRGVRVSDCSSTFSPNGADEQEYDAEITLACYVRIAGKEKTDRQPALVDLFALQRAVVKLFRDDPTLGGRACNSLVRSCLRGYDVFDGDPFAVANIPLIVNPRGADF